MFPETARTPIESAIPGATPALSRNAGAAVFAIRAPTSSPRTDLRQFGKEQPEPAYCTNFDMSVYKGFKPTEKVRMQFRAEELNISNHTQWRGVNNYFTFRVCSYAASPELRDLYHVLTGESAAVVETHREGTHTMHSNFAARALSQWRHGRSSAWFSCFHSLKGRRQPILLCCPPPPSQRYVMMKFPRTSGTLARWLPKSLAWSGYRTPRHVEKEHRQSGCQGN